MDFDFEKLRETATDLADKAVQGVNYVAQKGKDKYKELSLENELNKAQRQLGELYYNHAKNGESNSDLMDEFVASIDNILEELKAFGKTPVTEDEEETERFCPTCGAPILDKDAMFCAKCGAKLQ